MAVPQYKIPESQIGGFDLLVQLPADKKKLFLDAVKQVSVGFPPEALAQLLTDKIELPQEELTEILTSLTGLLFLKDTTTDPLDTFATSIVEAYKQDRPDTTLDDTFKLFIIEFLVNAQNYKITVKANQLAFDRENIATKFRILTDVRPIFDDEDGTKIRGSVVIHNLSIDYRQQKSPKKIVLAVDENDLIELRKLLQRALDKQAAIKETLTNSQLKHIESR